MASTAASTRRTRSSPALAKSRTASQAGGETVRQGFDGGDEGLQAGLRGLVKRHEVGETGLKPFAVFGESFGIGFQQFSDAIEAVPVQSLSVAFLGWALPYGSRRFEERRPGGLVAERDASRRLALPRILDADEGESFPSASICVAPFALMARPGVSMG
jgi:hypothetical protein